MRKFSDHEVTQILSEYFDDNKVFLICSKHGALKNSGVAGCKECSTLFWRAKAAKMPPAMRAEALERVYELVRKLIKHEDELKKVELLRHPIVNIEKGVN